MFAEAALKTRAKPVVHRLALFVSCCVLVGAVGFALAQAPSELFSRAFTLLQDGETELAIELFRKGLESEPENGLAHYFLGLALVRKSPSDEAAAIEHFRKSATLLKGKPEGVEAGMRAEKLEVKRQRTNLLANPSALNGRWCYKGPNYEGAFTVDGDNVSIRETGGSNTGSIKILSASQFQMTVRGFLSTAETVYELFEPDAWRAVLVGGKPYTGSSAPVRRC